MSAPEPSWMDREPGWSDAFRQLARLHRRALVRLRTTLAVTALLALAVVVFRAQQHRSFRAEVIFRVTEGDIEFRTSPRANKDLKDFVSGTAFATPRLLEVIRRHGLYRKKMAADPLKAVESMREDIEVEVARNYFMIERGPDDPPRSAVVSIEYRGGDPDTALAVVQDLARLVEDQESAVRRGFAQIAAREAEEAYQLVRAELVRLEQRRAVLGRDLAVIGGDKGTSLVQLATVERQIEIMEEERKGAEERRSALHLREGMEAGGLGITFDRIDTRSPSRPFFRRRVELGLIAVAAYLLLLPFVGMAVGAFGKRIDGAEDVRMLNMVAFGHVPGARDARATTQKRSMV
jgi:hypothetical protein